MNEVKKHSLLAYDIYNWAHENNWATEDKCLKYIENLISKVLSSFLKE